MGVNIQKRLDILVGDVQSIRKDLFLSRIGQKHRSRRTLASWADLSRKISADWDSISAVDEIVSQREKQW